MPPLALAPPTVLDTLMPEPLTGLVLEDIGAGASASFHLALSCLPRPAPELPPNSPEGRENPASRTGYRRTIFGFPKRRGGDSRTLLRKLPSSSRRPARLGPLAARQSKGTVSQALAPSRVRNPPGPYWEPLRGVLRETVRRGGDSNPQCSCEHNGFRGLGRSSVEVHRVCMNTALRGGSTAFVSGRSATRRTRRRLDRGRSCTLHVPRRGSGDSIR